MYHQVEVTSECDVEDCSRVCVCAVLPVDTGQGACIADTAQCLGVNTAQSVRRCVRSEGLLLVG